jgi:hypothetical protein
MAFIIMVAVTMEIGKMIVGIVRTTSKVQIVLRSLSLKSQSLCLNNHRRIMQLRS